LAVAQEAVVQEAVAQEAVSRKAKDAKGRFAKTRLKPQKSSGSQSSLQSESAQFSSPRVVRLGEGNIAVISNGLARTLATLGQLQQRGSSVAAFVNLQEAIGADVPARADADLKADFQPVGKADFQPTSPEIGTALKTQLPLASLIAAEPLPLDAFTLKRQLLQALQELARLRGVKVILINWRSASLPCRILADALIEYQSKLALQARRPAQPLPLVVRMAGEGAEIGYQRLLDREAIALEATVEAAISRSMGLARMGRHGADGE
jgi:succinyl-CoA synthetase beta subunit